MQYFKNIYRARYILFSLVRQDLKNKYRNSLLGIAWSLLTPLGLVTIIGFVFSVVLGQPIKEFIPFLFSGLMPWFFIVESASGGTVAFIVAEGYIKQTQTPVEIFPIRVSLGAFINLIYSLLAFFIVYLFISFEKFNLNMFMIIPALMIWLILGISLSTIAAIINTYIRDYAHLQSLVLQGLFYATPIMFPPEMLKARNFSWIYMWNPFYYMMEIIRKPLLGDKIPELFIWIVALLFTLILFIIAVILMTRINRKITFLI
ncbi:ABC transporter permease [Caloranaerobacter azorensis]|uniref:Transport permease protein n=2 Tax=Caloranaerobacter azorensis TaxID=116090 RepID=A0A1M5SZP9_9FIRM|nr:ABC transporter permease [Caloranaerobacter azorensis]QIB27583.1 ABC transporter permease [Caloranaerobacter azorensis]SHH43984.1 lipopolysaccharide transport system permease protein [Caloranaerobacter azorensis DSM 13643]